MLEFIYFSCVIDKLISFWLTACGEFKKIVRKVEDKVENESTEAGDFGLCSYTVISDRFAITAEHCILPLLDKGQFRTVSIRDNTKFREKIGVRRVWKHPGREAKEVPGAYYDIAIMELGKMKKNHKNWCIWHSNFVFQYLFVK